MNDVQLSLPANDQRPAPELDPAETFGSIIRAFVYRAESNVPTDYSISRLLSDFRFEKRRLYDVMSVLCAVGCCCKISPHCVRWIGMCRVSLTLLQIQRDARADSDIPLDSIITSHTTVSISSLTVSFLLCFLALHMRTLKIKQISRYLSRQTGRHKSTLCKLYQIAHILEASGIILQADMPGSLSIADRYWAPLDLNVADEAQNNLSPFRIQALLNRLRPDEERILLQRRMDFAAESERELSELPEPGSDAA
jgi:hypothetical protein